MVKCACKQMGTYAKYNAILSLNLSYENVLISFWEVAAMNVKIQKTLAPKKPGNQYCPMDSDYSRYRFLKTW